MFRRFINIFLIYLLVSCSDNDSSELTIVPAPVGQNSTVDSIVDSSDTTNPTPPTSIDISANNASASESVMTSWSASTDDTAVVSYEFAISASNSVNDIISGGSWTSTGTNLSGRLISGINLLGNTNYYTLVRAKDAAGNISTVSSSSAWSYVGLCSTGTIIFSYTGSDQSFSIPTNCTSITVKAWGAGGGGYGSGYGSGFTGGGGGYATATLAVTEGETLDIIVGGGGRAYPNYMAYGDGGKGSGVQTAPGCDCPGSGGGRSEITRSSVPLIVAGAGGGAGANTGGCNDGGAGGGVVGEKSQHSNSCTAAPGTQASYDPIGGDATTAYGGGGGAGYMGGEGAQVPNAGFYGEAGAGGSSYVTGTSTSTSTGAGATAGNTADTDRAGAAQGGAHGQNGANGLVIISYQ